MKICAQCGAPMNSMLPNCKYCGSENIDFADASDKKAAKKKLAKAMRVKNKIVAGLLAIFFGTFGLHKFYLGESSRGVLHLLFFWTGIPTIVGIVEGIYYLLMKDHEFMQKYNS